MGDIFGTSNSIFNDQKKPLLDSENEREPIDFMSDLSKVVKTPPPPQEFGALDYTEDVASGVDRGLAKLPVGIMDFAASTGTNLMGGDIQDDLLYKAARKYEGFINELVPGNDALGPTGDAISEGLGQVLGLVASGGASMGTTGIANMGKMTTGIMTTGMGTSEGLRDAQQAGANTQDMGTAGLTGTLSGLTEFAPIGKIAGILNKTAPGLVGKVLDIFKSAGAEGLQELVQQGMINTGARLTYDEERELSKNLGESFKVGGAVGAIAATIATILGVKPRLPDVADAALEESLTDDELDNLPGEESPAPSAVPTKEEFDNMWKQDRGLPVTPEQRMVAQLNEDQAAAIQQSLTEQLRTLGTAEQTLPTPSARVVETAVEEKILPELPTISPEQFQNMIAEEFQTDARKKHALDIIAKRMQESLPQNVETAPAEEVTPVEEPVEQGKPAQVTTESAELEVLQEMLKDPEVAQEDKKLLQSRLDELQGVDPNERRTDYGRREKIQQMVDSKDVEGLAQEMYNDSLTGLLNAKAWNEVQHVAELSGQTLASLDLAGMKFINDTYGHPAGDALLKIVGETLQSSGLDVYRKGGDEFAAVIDSDTDEQAVLDKLQQEVAKRTVTYVDPEGKTHKFTGWRIDYGTGKSFDQADENLYNKRTKAVEDKQRNEDNKQKPYGLVIETTGGRDVADQIVEDHVAETLAVVDEQLVETEEPTVSAKVFTVKSFTKIGNLWLGQTVEGETAAIVKEGKFYKVFVGTANEIQAGTAMEVGKYPSLPKAKLSLKTGEETEVATPVSKEAFVNRIDALKAIAEKQKKKKIQDLVDLDVEPEIADDFISLDELAAEEAAVDAYGDMYENRGFDDVAKDLFTILSDDRGAISPIPNAEIAAAKSRIQKDISNLTKMAKKTGSELLQTLTDRLKKLWASVTKPLKNERGSVDMDPVRGFASEIASVVKKIYIGVREHAHAFKKWGQTRKRSDATQHITEDQQTQDLNFIQKYMQTITSAYKTNMDEGVRKIWERMISTKRIVGKYKKGSKVAPERQVPWIDTETKPGYREGVTDFKISSLATNMRSPSAIFKNFFQTWANPSADMAEAGMAFLTNLSNNKRWAKDVLKGVQDSSKVVSAALDKAYEGSRKLYLARDRNIRRLSRLQEDLRNHTQTDENKKVLISKIKETKLRIKKASTKLNKELQEKYDTLIPILARKHADVRITLQVAEELPAGIELSPEELAVADKIKDFFNKSKKDLEAAGIPVINARAYMHHILPEVLNDSKWSGYAKDAELPLAMKFLSQSEDSRIWYPSMHMILESYIPMAERKIAFQPFLSRWTKSIDSMPEELRVYMNQWVNKNLFRDPMTDMDKFVNAAVAFEYIRLIGGSISVGIKHASKSADSLARYDAITNTKAGKQVFKAIAERTGAAFGMDVGTMNDDMIRAFVNSQVLVKMMDETPNMTSTGRLIRQIAGAPVNAVETVDNGLTIFSTILSAHSKNLSPEQASRIIWETVLAANFRGGHDQPLAYKNPKFRAVAMFQMTPHKLWEYRGEVFTRALHNESDAFGTPYGVILARYIMLFGLAETALRALFKSSIIDQIAHFPYMSHWISAEKGGYELHAPKLTTSPLLDYAYQMGATDPITATKKHFDYWGQMSKMTDTARGKYPSTYYTNPLMFHLGIKKVGAKAKGSTATRKRKKY